MGGKSGTSTSSVSIPPQVLARYNAVNAQAQSVASQPFQQYSTDPNAFVAPINQQQYAGIGGINNAANMAQPAYGAAEQGTYNAAQGLSGAGYQQGVQQYMNPYLQNAVGATAAEMNNVNQQQQQRLAGNAISAGAFGGDRSGIAQANLMNQQNLAMGQTLGQMESQGYQNAAQNYMTGLGQQGALYNQLGNLGAGAQNAAMQGAQAQIGAGTLEQQTQQAGQTALYNQFLQQQAYPFQVAQFLANIAEGTGALSGSTTTSTYPMPFFSDRRLKKNIERIGETDEGLPIHKFEYKGDSSHQKHIGFMADEVEKIHPEAVGLHPSGFKMVDYDKASSEGGAVGPQHAGLGFARGGFADGGMPAGLANMIASQEAQQPSGGGVNAGLAAAAQAIAPQPVVPASVYQKQSYNVFADPKYQPDLSETSSTGKGLGNQHGYQGNQNYNTGTTTTTTYGNPFFGGGNDQSAEAKGGRIGHADGGPVEMDPYSLEAIAYRQQQMYNALMQANGMRGMSGMPGKNSVVPESSSWNRPLITSQTQKPQATMSAGDAMYYGSKASDLYNKYKAANPPQTSSADSADYSPDVSGLGQVQGPDLPAEARGGLVGFADGGATDQTPDPADDVYSDEATDATKRDIPDKPQKYTLATAQNPTGNSSQSASGLSIGQALALPGQISGAMSGLGSLLGFLSTGGVAGREHHDGSDGNVVGDPIDNYAKSIAGIESGGEKDPYSALGPVTKNGDRAYGKYQVMGSNVPSWTQETLGKSMTPDEFLKDKNAQEAVFKNKFGQYVDKYGNPDDAASMWFSGRPVAKAGNASDQLGTTVPAYLDKFHAGLGLADRPASNAANASGTEAAPQGRPQTLGNVSGDITSPSQPSQSGTYLDRSQQEGPIGKLVHQVPGLGNLPTSENVWVPALAGLGSMLSSKSHFLLPAIGEGLLGGTAAYTNLQQQQANIGNKLAETGLTQETTNLASANVEKAFGDIARENLVEKQGQLFVMVPTANGYTYISPQKARELIRSGGLTVDPRGTPRLSGGAPAASDLGSAGGAPAPQGGLNPPASSAPVTSTPLPDITPKAGTTTPPVPDLSAGQQTVEPRKPKMGELGQNDIQKVQQISDAIGAAGPLIAEKNWGDQLTDYDQDGREARTIQRNLIDYTGELSVRPQAGPYAPGSTSETTQKAAGVLNGILGTLGLPPLSEEWVGAQSNEDSIRKAASRLSQDAAKAGNQHAEAALRDFAKSFPTEATTREGAAENMAQILTQNWRRADMQDASYNWREAASQADPNTASRTGAAFAKWFDDKYAPQIAEEKAGLKRMFLDPVKIGGKEIQDPVTKQPMSVMRYVSMMGPKLPPSFVEWANKTYGGSNQDIMRYFPMVQR